MKRILWLLIVGFALAKLVAQSYFDINFAGENGVIPQAIQVTNLTRGTSVTIQGTDVLRLNTLVFGLNNPDLEKSLLLVYPNPMHQNGFFGFSNPQQGKVAVQLHSLNGKLLHHNNFDLPPGEQLFAISGISAGVYLLTVITPTETVTAQVISSGKSESQPITSTIKQENQPGQQDVKAEVSRVQLQSDGLIEMGFSIGDELRFSASALGYASQSMYVSPTANQTLTFFLTQVKDVVNPGTGAIWMDRNLGATRAALSTSDYQGFGDLYQWGRCTDGHEKRNSLTTSIRSSTDVPGHGKFITANTAPWDWQSPQNYNLWQGVIGTNNPCPEGYRIPTIAEWTAERATWSMSHSGGAYASTLKLIVAGYRSYSDGSIGNNGMYWSSTISGTNVQILTFNLYSSIIQNGGRIYGNSVRCIKEVVNSATLPVITTAAITAISLTSATSGGEIASDGGAIVTSRGVVWSTNPTPTVEVITKTNNGTGVGTFASSMTGLSPATNYFVRAYATNSAGTAYGNELSFTTSSESGGEVPFVLNPTTGKIWMDRNLGASSVATSLTDADAYGDLYQWGRDADGHQRRTSSTTNDLSIGDIPGHDKFIKSPGDWRSAQNNDLWQGRDGFNNPCPGGYRVPTIAEWTAESASWSSINATGAFASPLKLTLAGYRERALGRFYYVGTAGHYWSSTVDRDYANYQLLNTSSSFKSSELRADALSVRCIKD